jgi:surface antigen
MPGPMIRVAAVAVLVAIACTGCATMEANPKTTVGALGGGAFGGLIAAAAGGGGAAIAGAIIGGALIGGAAGNYLDQRDKQMAAQAQQQALEVAPTNHPVAWNNPDTGHRGTVTPVRTYEAQGTYCREFQTDVVIDNKSEKAHGTACRQPDGSWKVQS